jgi:hypothetical protein
MTSGATAIGKDQGERRIVERACDIAPTPAREIGVAVLQGFAILLLGYRLAA